MLSRIRRWWHYGAVLGLCVGTTLFAWEVDAFLPLKTWQIWRFGYMWIVASAWSFSIVAAGHASLRAWLPRPLPVLEHLALSFSVGLLLFQLGVFLFGLFGLLDWRLYFGLPLAFALSGGWSLLRYVRRLARHVSKRPRSLSATGMLLGACGFVGLVAIYVPIITPSHIGFDSGMYHVPIAEHYLADGAIRRFADGWIPGTYPQMASLLYTWGLLTPKLDFLDRLVLLAHLEFVIFVMTLVSVSALTRRLLGPGRGRFAWVACFAFPCLILHDLQLAADHLAALWFAPIYLGLFRAWESLDFRYTSLTAACAAGAVLTKYTAYPMVVLPALAILVRGAYLCLRSPTTRARAIGGLAAALGAGIALTASHWLKNMVWYGDPLYPTLSRYFQPRPWSPDAALVTDVYLNKLGTYPAPRTWAGVVETFKSLYFFSFRAHEFYEYHRNVPYFGSLFTVATFATPFLRISRRTWALLLGLYVSLFIWYWLSHVDRYLQAFLPGMAAVIAVVFWLSWQRGWLFRVPIVAATALQLVWGADVFSLPVQVERYRRSLSALGATYHGGDPLRAANLGSWMAVGATLPPEATLLIHEGLWHLGVQRRTVNDWIGLQAGISYGRLNSAREVYDLLQQLRVTHLAWGLPPMNDDSLAGDLRFLDFAQRFTKNRQSVGGIRISAMPSSPPPAEPKDWVFVQACAEPYAPGLYAFEQTSVPAILGQKLAPYPAPVVPLIGGELGNQAELIARATFAVTRGDANCDQKGLALVRTAMQQIGSRSGATLWGAKR